MCLENTLYWELLKTQTINAIIVFVHFSRSFSVGFQYDSTSGMDLAFVLAISIYSVVDSEWPSSVPFFAMRSADGL